MILNSGTLFGIAKRAYERARDAATHDRSYQSDDPLVAIVFSAAAGEALINELGELACGCWDILEQTPEQVKTLGRVLSEAESSRGTTTLKVLLAKLALTGETFDKGGNPYQDFATLMDLRNSVMHLKFDRLESVKVNEIRIHHPKVIEKLRSKNILTQFEDEKTTASWVVHVSTAAVGRWACNATAAMAKDIVESIPRGHLREQADLFYYRFDAFAPVS